MRIDRKILTFVGTVEALVNIIVDVELVDEGIILFIDSAELAKGA
jgi:hypothetical protein